MVNDPPAVASPGPRPSDPVTPAPTPNPPAGRGQLFLAGVLTAIALIYLAGMSILAALNLIDECLGTGYNVFFLAIIAAISSALFIGYADLRGPIGQLVQSQPIVINFAGSFAIFLIVLLSGTGILSDRCDQRDGNIYLKLKDVITKKTTQILGPTNQMESVDILHKLTISGDGFYYRTKFNSESKVDLDIALSPTDIYGNNTIEVPIDIILDAAEVRKFSGTSVTTTALDQDHKLKKTYNCKLVLNINSKKRAFEFFSRLSFGSGFPWIHSVREPHSQDMRRASATFDPEYFRRVDEVADRGGDIANASPSEWAATCFKVDGDAVQSYEFDLQTYTYKARSLDLQSVVESPTAAPEAKEDQESDVDLGFPPVQPGGTGRQSWLPSTIDVAQAVFASPAVAQENQNSGELVKAAVERALTVEELANIGDSVEKQTTIFDVSLNPARAANERAAAIRIPNAVVEASAPDQWTLASRRSMLPKPIPFLNTRVARFVDLVSAESADLRFEAWNFVRKYPIDAFDNEFKVRRPEGPADQYLAYAATYFYYNRILAMGSVGGKLSAADITAIEAESVKGKAWAAELEGALAIDKAILDYGLAYVFFASARGDEAILKKAQASANDFLKLVQNEDGRYLFPTHVAQALAFATGNEVSARSIARQARKLANEPVFVDPKIGSTDYDVKSLDIRRAPDLGGETLGKLSPDQEVKLMGRIEGWDLVKAPTGIGWIER